MFIPWDEIQTTMSSAHAAVREQLDAVRSLAKEPWATDNGTEI